MPRRFIRGRKPLATATKKRRSTGREKNISPALQASVLGLLAKQNAALNETEIARALGLSRHELVQLCAVLGRLLEQGAVGKKGRRFALAAGQERLRGTLDLTAKGFGYAIPEGEQAKGGKDVYIAAHNLNGASQGDTILVAITGSGRSHREGRVIQILHRAVTQICGIFTASGAGGYVTPDDDRFPATLLIRRNDTLAAGDGMAVVAEIVDYGSERQGPSGRIVELLGDGRTASVQIRMAVLQGGLRERFPAEADTEAAELLPVTACAEGRQDLRHLPHVTIDGETARDFDDAICVERSGDQFVLYVSIADVSHYVRTGSAIDREAYLRGTSVYLPDRVLPMLPERLSNDLCSLVPDQDRPAFTAILRFDATGRRIGERYTKSLIKSRQRFTYTTVNQLLYLNEPQAQAAHRELVPMLEQASALTELLKKRRLARGSLEFNIPEPEVTLAGETVAAISLAERNRAHMLIEDCMLAANEAVAETLAKARHPVLYRIHEYPDPAKLEAFTDAAKALGFRLPQSEVNPAWFAQAIEQARNSPAEYIVNNLLLRTMQQARYSPENSGHFGLAAPYYLHFTSPIRRYPDLVAHRVLANLLAGHASDHARPVPAKTADLAEAGIHLSQCERKAIDVERNAHARCSCLLLMDRIGEVFAAIISGVTAFGLYVTLDDSYISGMVPLTSMADDYYLHDSRRYRLIGEASNRMYQLGDRVLVRLEQVDFSSKRLVFSLAPR
ncbi:MAG: ribonuclease R [Desulfobulbus sp.]|jgi:ribonuclease R|uniref:ribonuclease R n=1 Tax=Desulfobulbus sp. TaxID=895 RepID=UPI002845BF6A|nr:ribonuclease R [Desulfobulbus sp.]MDR2549849.1 ribonuclease R [Desulfobulbus sp.]